MVIASFGLLFIAPSVAVGLLVARRTTKLFAFCTMMVVFSVTVLTVQFLFGRVFNSTEDIVILVAELLVALTVVGVKLPLVSKLYSSTTRTTPQ